MATAKKSADAEVQPVKTLDLNDLITSDEALNVIDNGGWVENLPGFPGFRVKVTGMSSKAARDLLASKIVKERAKKNFRELTEERTRELTREVLGEAVLQDWDGLTNNGEPVPFDRALAIKWINSRNGEKLANVVLFASARIDGDAQSFVEAAVKN